MGEEQFAQVSFHSVHFKDNFCQSDCKPRCTTCIPSMEKKMPALWAQKANHSFFHFVNEAFYSFAYEVTPLTNSKNNATYQFSAFYVQHSAVAAIFFGSVAFIATLTKRFTALLTK